MKRVDEITLVLKNAEEQVRKEYRAEVMGVFGSYARGEEKTGSDLDVLFKFLEGATLLDLVGLADLLEEKLGVRVDIVAVDTIRKEIKDAVVREAVYI
ncbi:MAG: nucleotidyltransferase family protein [Chloroflexi bacterium]|nr:nucleotidyltransferase family protein [Chloroflexota bacterium]